MAFHPYLNFRGNCREAFTRYEEIFGGELVVFSMSEIPDQEVPPEQADLVMHAALRSGDQLLMGSDAPFEGFVLGESVWVNYEVATIDDATRVFEALSEGGDVRMPIAPTFWSPMFGMCIDRFGTPWMVGVTPEEPQG